MVRNYKRLLSNRRYCSYTDDQLQAAVSDVKNGTNLRATAAKYGIPLGTLSHKVNKKFVGKPGHPTVFNEAEEASFVKHIKVVAEWGFPFDVTDMRMLAREYLKAQRRNVSCFKNNLPSADWAYSFIKRHSKDLTIRLCQNIKSKKAAVSVNTVKAFFDNLSVSLKDVPPSHIFNYDETNLVDNAGVKKCIFKRGTKYPERIQDSNKSCISLMFCGSAGGKMMPAYVVYKSEHLWSTWTEGGPKGTRYSRSKSGWFDLQTFTDWFEFVFVTQVKKLNGTKVIIGDNLSSHFSENVIRLAQDNNIKFICLPPNTTHLLQPLDVAFYAPLKKCWRKVLDGWKTKRSKTTCCVTKDNFPSLLKNLYEHLYNSEKHETSDNLAAGFAKCGIYPFNPDKVLQRLPDFNVRDQAEVQSDVSQAVVNTLKNLRGIGEDVDIPVKRRKRILVEPGCSISMCDIHETQQLTSESLDATADLETVDAALFKVPNVINVTKVSTDMQPSQNQATSFRIPREAKAAATSILQQTNCFHEADTNKPSCSGLVNNKVKVAHKQKPKADKSNFCSMCSEYFYDQTSDAMWIQCTSCKLWQHEMCGNPAGHNLFGYVCPDCDE